MTRSSEVERRIGEIDAAFEALERIVRKGQAGGELREDLDARIAAVVFYGALEEILAGWVLGQIPDDDEDIARAEQTVVEILCDGLLSAAS